MFSLLDDLSQQHKISDQSLENLPILPLRGTVAFPFMILPLSIGVTRSTKLVKWAVEEGSLIGLVTSKQPEIDEPDTDQLYEVGVIARVHRVIKSDKDNTLQVIVQGIERIKIDQWVETEPFLRAKVTLVPDIVAEEKATEIEALRRRILELSRAIVEHLPQIPNEVNQFLERVEDPRIIV